MVKLLFDENLPRRLVSALDDLFPGSIHVGTVGLSQADDGAVWRYAAEHEFVIVSKDGDFNQMSFLHGAPPKVVWLRAGNCTTHDALVILRANAERMRAFAGSEAEALLIIER
jgi:predicted nuclease of predicted toxin-antitoxin system